MEIKGAKPVLLLERGELSRYAGRLLPAEQAYQRKCANPGSEAVAVYTWDDLMWRWHLHGWLCLPQGAWELLPREPEMARLRDVHILMLKG